MRTLIRQNVCILYSICYVQVVYYFIFQVVNSVRIRRAGDWSARIIRLTGWMPIRADASMSNPKPKTGERSQKHSRTGTTPISDSISNRARYEIGSSAHNLL